MLMLTDGIRSPEVIPTITLSPERVGEALNLETDEVRAQLRSIGGRKKLLEDLQRDPQKLASVIDSDSLRVFEQDMEMTEQDLKAEKQFLEAQKNPEKKGMFRRAWDTVTGFPRKHPLITVTLLGVVLGVVASYMGWLPRINFPGLWGRAQGWMGWGSAGTAAGEVAGETAVETTAVEGVAEGASATEAASQALRKLEDIVPVGKEIPTEHFEGAFPFSSPVYTPVGTQLPSNLVTKIPRIGIFEDQNMIQHYLFNNKVYTLEQLPELIEELPALRDDEYVSVVRFASSRPSSEISLAEVLEKLKLGIHWDDRYANVEFVPTKQ